jgi:hypothetical protein
LQLRNQLRKQPGMATSFVTHQSAYKVCVSQYSLAQQAFHVQVFRSQMDEDRGYVVGFDVLPCFECRATNFFVGSKHHIVLLCVANTNRQYVAVDNQITSFTCLAPVNQLISQTNTDAVYPSCVDLAGNVYLIHEKVVLRQPPANVDYYGWYYRNYSLSSKPVHRNGIFDKFKPAKPAKPGFMNILHFFVKNQKSMLYYTGFPSNEYTRLMNLPRDSNQTTDTGFPNDMAVQIGKQFHKVDRQKFIKLHKAFGKLMHFEGLQTKTLDSVL